MGRLAIDFLNNTFITDAGTPEKNISLLDQIDDGETFSTCRSLHFPNSASHFTEVSTISGITINSDSLSAYTLVASTIGYQHTDEQ